MVPKPESMAILASKTICMEAVFVYGTVEERQRIRNGQLRANKLKTVRTMVGSAYSAGEGRNMTRVTYSGEVGALIGWNGGAAGIGGKSEGLDCNRAKGGLGC